MKTVSLSGSLRENVGKKDAKKIRREGKVPCVIYGGEEQVHFALGEKDFKKIIFTPEVFNILITINGKEYSTVLQDIQYHPVKDNVLHADFLEIFPEKALAISIPVKYEGTAPGIIKGGKLITKIRKLRVKGLIEDMLEYIVLDISNLEIGNSIKVRDVQLDKLQLLDISGAVIVSVKTARGVVLDESEGGEESEESEEEATK